MPQSLAARPFLDQSAKIAELASRMATPPLDALKEASDDKPPA